jgi:flagellin
MIGGLTSSLALAQRTADAASARMAKVSRQIATGKEVASAKDDGARYVQAAALKSQKVQWEGRRQLADRLDLAIEYTKGAAAAHQEIASKLREVALQASALPAGSNARRALQADWDALIAAGKSTTAGINPGFEDNSVYFSDAQGVGMDVSGHDSYWAGNRYAAYHNTGDWTGHYGFVNAGWGIVVALDTVDIINGSPAQLNDAMSTAAIISGETYNTWNTGWQMQGGADQRVLDMKRADITRQEDRLESAIGSLTDADLGKLSTQNQQAQVRQQLALDTIKTALTAYGNYAGGLLGNVQRTQRSVTA